MGLHPVLTLWHRAARALNRRYLTWALSEISPLHDDVPYIVRRISELQR